MKYFYILFFVTICLSCSTVVNNDSAAPTVDIIKETTEVKTLDKYISDIDIIRLSSDSLTIMSPNKLIINGDRLIILFAGRVSEFSSTGAFVRNIGRVGNGPGEYLHIQDCCLNHSGDELLCLNHMNEVLIYSLRNGQFLNKIPAGNRGVTATAVLPLSDGKFALFYPNPPQADIMDFDKEFNCVRIYDKSGKEIEALSPREDFNISMGFTSPSVQSFKDSYVLSYKPGDGLCYVVKDGTIAPLLNITFGNHGIPNKEAVTGVDDPWMKISEIFEADYYKCPSSVCETEKVLYCSAFGKGSSVWNFALDKSLKHGIRWRSIGGYNPPMRALAADKDYLYFCFGEIGFADPSKTEDLLQKIIIERSGLVLGEEDNPVLVKVKFKRL